jgi:ABC-2 type transport system permease protein
MSQTATTRDAPFAPGTFAPRAAAESMPRIVRALSWLEFKLFVRNAEQLAINMVIPVATLMTLCLAPIGNLGEHRAGVVVPAVLAAAVMSSAFTGQAIAVGFDRRYGALKRLGATMAPPWAIIVGKSVAVMAVVALQAALIGGLGAALGWSMTPAGAVACAASTAVGAACFASMGLLLGGSLRAEIVLALANVLWFLQLGICAATVFATPTGTARLLLDMSPPGALADALHAGAHGVWAWPSLAVLVAWACAAAWAATKTFRFI